MILSRRTTYALALYGLLLIYSTVAFVVQTRQLNNRRQKHRQISSSTTTTTVNQQPQPQNQQLKPSLSSIKVEGESSTCLSLSASPHDVSDSESANPQSFREAEVLGLKLMQEGQYQLALDAFQKGLKLPGSRPDVLRTKRVSGPSPVGGAAGGTNSEQVFLLDEFELQAAHYNMACAHAQLAQSEQALLSLRRALEYGFDNFATVRDDPDLAVLQQVDQATAQEFDDLLKEFMDPKGNNDGGGFNPFGLFRKN